MNVKLEYDMSWSAGIWFEDRLQCNNYQITLNMITNTSDTEDQITCMNRINHFVYDEMGSTVYINESSADQIALLASAGINLTTLPEEPIDQIIGWVIFLKLNAILEQRMIITDIKIQSELGSNIKYVHTIGESLGPVTDLAGWWMDPAPIHSSTKSSTNKKDIIKLRPSTSWKKLGMTWTTDINSAEKPNTVVFAQFSKDDDE